jgi:hypothetical protein
MMILSKPKQLEILKTILVNRILMVFQNQPMLGNGPASMWGLDLCDGLARPCMLAIVGGSIYSIFIKVSCSQK